MVTPPITPVLVNFFTGLSVQRSHVISVALGWLSAAARKRAGAVKALLDWRPALGADWVFWKITVVYAAVESSVA
jgi:hypothetical protein